MNKRKAAMEYKKSKVVMHAMLLIDNTMKGIKFAVHGGGVMGGLVYEAHVMPDRELERFEKKMDTLRHWMAEALREGGIDPDKWTTIGRREWDLLRVKIEGVNRWCRKNRVPQWREMVIGLASLNAALTYIRHFFKDTARLRMVTTTVEDILLMIGTSEDWVVAMDLFDATKKTILAGVDLGSLTSEEEFFLRLAAMPTPRSDMERAIIEDRGYAPTAAEAIAAEGGAA